MGKKWLQLLQVKIIERNGKRITYHKGDFVQVGNQTALHWIAEGSARSLTTDISEYVPDNESSGVYLIAHPEVGREQLKEANIQIDHGRPQLPWGCTFLWNPDAPLRPELLAVGFNLLETWEFACPLLPYEQLANTIGSPDEQAKTKDLIGDLRIPMYDPRMMFVRKTKSTEWIIEQWQLSVERGENEHHALLRALYIEKPLLLALPPTWTHPGFDTGDDDW